MCRFHVFRLFFWLESSLDNSSRVVGSLDVIARNYNALETNFAANISAIPGNYQCMDHRRIADTRVTNMDGIGTIGDHSTHVIGLKISTDG